MKMMMMLLAAGASATPFDTKWEAFKTDYSKTYTTSEEPLRKQSFLKNLMQVGEFATPSRHADLPREAFLSQIGDDIRGAIPAKVKASSYNISMIEQLLPIAVDVDVSGWQFSVNGTMPCNYEPDQEQRIYEQVSILGSTPTHWITKSSLFHTPVRVPKVGQCFRDVPELQTTPPPQRRFFQRQCDDELCSDHCSTMPFLLDACLQIEGGGSLIAVECNAGVGLAVIQYLGTDDCTGFAIHTSQPIDSCQPNSVPGSYFVNFCTKPNNVNITNPIDASRKLRVAPRGL